MSPVLPWTTRHPPRFFADETIVGVGRALALVRPDVLHTGHRSLPEVPLGTKDPVWMPVVAARDLVVISRDRRITTRPAELELFRRHRLRAFWIAGKRDRALSNWTYLRRLVRFWDTIERIIDERGPGPWFYAINETRVSEIRLRSR